MNLTVAKELYYIFSEISKFRYWSLSIDAEYIWHERDRLVRVILTNTVKPAHSKIPQIGFQDQLSLNAGQKYCRMLHILNLLEK